VIARSQLRSWDALSCNFVHRLPNSPISKTRAALLIRFHRSPDKDQSRTCSFCIDQPSVSQVFATIMADNQDTINERMLKFSSPAFDPAKTNWSAYISQFEQLCKVKGLGGTGATSPNATNARRDLLLAYVGSEHLEAVSIYFYPDAPNTKTYDQLKTAFNDLYKPQQTVFAARIEFDGATRKKDESFTQFANRLRNISRNCDYGANQDERLRDHFVAGLNHKTVERECRQRWPDAKADNVSVPFSTVFTFALSIERAENEVDSFIAAAEATNAVRKKKSAPSRASGGKKQESDSADTTSDDEGPRIIDPQEECVRCGKQRHVEGQNCPAKKSKCRECQEIGHWDRVCINTGRATLKKAPSTKGRGKGKKVHAVGDQGYERVYDYDDDDDAACY